MDHRILDLIFHLLRVSLFGDSADSKSFTALSEEEWKEIYYISTQHGVVAIAWDAIVTLAGKGVITPEQMPDRALKLQWALSAERVVKRYNKQQVLAERLAEAFAMEGISTNVLKGFAISGYYPTPEHRECGDLDCFLSSTADNGEFVCRYEDGNTIAANIGADVEVGFYKHSHINFKGLMVENHAFCTAIRGSRDRKALERHLQNLLATNPSTPIGDTHLLRPCADFNALFLTAHSFGHFLTEGIKLRHILDWAMLLQTEQDNIDWGSFYAWCDRLHYTKFVDALTAISIKYLGLNICNPHIHTDSPLRDKVLRDVLFSERSIHNTKASKFKKRMMIIRNKLFGGWKYRELYEKSAFIDTLQMVTAFITERKPRL